MRARHNWPEIQTYHDQGHGFVACRKKFGCTHYSWSKAIKRGELLADLCHSRGSRCRYDWDAVQAYYDDGHTYRDCREQFGFAPASWTKAVHRGALKARARRRPLAAVLASASDRVTVKRYLMREGILENRCSDCGISEWRGRPLKCHIDHINGIRDDHRLGNLRMLCPNCHSQTDTYGGKNVRRKRLQEAPPLL